MTAVGSSIIRGSGLDPETKTHPSQSMSPLCPAGEQQSVLELCRMENKA